MLSTELTSFDGYSFAKPGEQANLTWENNVFLRSVYTVSDPKGRVIVTANSTSIETEDDKFIVIGRLFLEIQNQSFYLKLVVVLS